MSRLGTVVIGSLGVLGLMLCVVLAIAANGGKRGNKDPKTKKPTAEVIIELNEAFAYENYVSCPDCGRTDYMHIQMTMVSDKPIAVITFWHNHIETQKRRQHIFGSNDPFDPFGGFGARDR